MRKSRLSAVKNFEEGPKEEFCAKARILNPS